MRWISQPALRRCLVGTTVVLVSGLLLTVWPSKDGFIGLKLKPTVSPDERELASITKDLQRVTTAYDEIFLAACKTEPRLGFWQKQHIDCKAACLKLVGTKGDRDIRAWISGAPNEADKDAQTDRRRAEVGRVRRFLLVQAIRKILAGQEAGPTISGWISSRRSALNRGNADIHLARANEWQVIGNSLFPDEPHLQALIEAGWDADAVQRYEEEAGLGEVDESMPQTGVEFLAGLMEAMIQRDAWMDQIARALPPQGQQWATQLEMLKSKLAALQQKTRGRSRTK